MKEDGYYAFPDGTIYSFDYRDDKTYTQKDVSNPILGVKTPRQMYVSYIKGMEQALWLQAYRGAQEHHVKYIFRQAEARITPDEDIIIDFVPVKDESELK